MIINRTPEFKRAYKKLKRKHYNMEKLSHVIKLIVVGDEQTLLRKHKLHQLKGRYRGLSEVHVDRQYNDSWVLVYRIHDGQLDLAILDLITTGNHDQVFR
jgi:mRNA interferase YafQ